MPESFFCGRLHPSRGMLDDYYLCYRVILCQKKKKKKQKGISQRDTLHCTQLIEKKNYMQLNTNSIHFFVAQTEIENPALFY